MPNFLRKFIFPKNGQNKPKIVSNQGFQSFFLTLWVPQVAGSGIGGCRGQSPLPCRVFTWVERAKNNAVLKKIELAFRKIQF